MPGMGFMAKSESTLQVRSIRFTVNDMMLILNYIT
jgi:hypothetical protein